MTEDQHAVRRRVLGAVNSRLAEALAGLAMAGGNGVIGSGQTVSQKSQQPQIEYLRRTETGIAARASIVVKAPEHNNGRGFINVRSYGLESPVQWNYNSSPISRRPGAFIYFGANGTRVYARVTIEFVLGSFAYVGGGSADFQEYNINGVAGGLVTAGELVTSGFHSPMESDPLPGTVNGVYTICALVWRYDGAGNSQILTPAEITVENALNPWYIPLQSYGAFIPPYPFS